MEQAKSFANSFLSFLKIRNGKFHNFCSFLFLLSLPLLLLYSPPTPLESKEVRFSIFKKKSGEESFSFYGQRLQILDGHLTHDPGYMVSHSDSSQNCNEGIPRPNSKSTVLLENLHNKCQIPQRSRVAARAGYDAIVFYNHSHINDKYTNYGNPEITTIEISNEDALRVLDYTFPKAVRYNVLIQSYDSNNIILQPFNEGLIFQYMIIFRTKLWLLYVQGVIYWIVLFGIWRWCLVPDMYSIWNIIRRHFYPSGTYDFLRDDAEHNLSPFLRLVYCILKWEVAKTIRYLYIDTARIIHQPWTLKVAQEDFKHVCYLGCGSFGQVTQEIFVRTKKKVAMKTVLKQNVIFLEAEILALGNCCDGIVKLLYGFVSPDHIHFVMEFMIGNLSDFKDDLLIFHARIYTVELGLAIETLHSFGINHRDLKPANIMLDANYHIKLCDFGCAHKFANNNEVIEEDNIGTKVYYAPENHLNQWTLGSDWWAFGFIVFEMFNSPHHEHFLNSYDTVNFLTTGTIDKAKFKHRLESIHDKGARKLLSGCLNADKFRNPFGATKLLSRESYMCVPIPTKQSENVLDHLPLRSGVIPEWEKVPKERAYIGHLITELQAREDYYVGLPPTLQNTEHETTDFYFDNADINCYKNNSLLGEYFV